MVDELRVQRVLRSVSDEHDLLGVEATALEDLRRFQQAVAVWLHEYQRL